jgi:hypothetical protein
MTAKPNNCSKWRVQGVCGADVYSNRPIALGLFMVIIRILFKNNDHFICLLINIFNLINYIICLFRNTLTKLSAPQLFSFVGTARKNSYF